MIKFYRLIIVVVALVSCTWAVRATAGAVRSPASGGDGPVAQRWTGCFLGGNFGHGATFQKYYDSDFSSNDAGSNRDAGFHRPRGLAGGGQVGCDYQSGLWVFGAQGLMDATAWKGAHSGLGTATVASSTTPWFATVTGRIGLAFRPELLFYVRGGRAWLRDSELVKDDDALIGSANVTRTGWVAGGGMEYLFGSNVSGFVEYNYMGFGSKTLIFDAFNIQRQHPEGGPQTFPQGVQQHSHIIVLGLNFRLSMNARR